MPPLCFFGTHRIFLGDLPGAIILAATFGGGLVGSLSDFSRIPYIEARARARASSDGTNEAPRFDGEAIAVVTAAAFAAFCASWAADFTGEYGDAALKPRIFDTAHSVGEAVSAVAPLAVAAFLAAGAAVLVFAMGHVRSARSVHTLALGAVAGADVAAILFAFGMAPPMAAHWLLSFGAYFGAFFFHVVVSLKKADATKPPQALPPPSSFSSKANCCCLRGCFRIAVRYAMWLLGVAFLWFLMAATLVSHVPVKMKLSEVNKIGGDISLPRSTRTLTDARIRAMTANGESTEFMDISIQAAPLIWSNPLRSPELIFRAWHGANEEVIMNFGARGSANFCIGPICLQGGSSSSSSGEGGESGAGGSGGTGGGNAWAGWRSVLSGPNINDHKRALGFAATDEPDAAAIKMAFREKAKVSHPDKVPRSASEAERKTAAARFANLDTARGELLFRAERFASGEL